MDYDHHSGINRLAQLLPEEAEQLQKTPFAIIQVRTVKTSACQRVIEAFSLPVLKVLVGGSMLKSIIRFVAHTWCPGLTKTRCESSL